MVSYRHITTALAVALVICLAYADQDVRLDEIASEFGSPTAEHAAVVGDSTSENDYDEYRQYFDREDKAKAKKKMEDDEQIADAYSRNSVEQQGENHAFTGESPMMDTDMMESGMESTGIQYPMEMDSLGFPDMGISDMGEIDLNMESPEMAEAAAVAAATGTPAPMTAQNAKNILASIPKVPADQSSDVQSVLQQQASDPYALSTPMMANGAPGMTNDQRRFMQEKAAGNAGMTPVPNRMDVQPIVSSQTPGGKVGGVDEPWQYKHPLQPFNPAVIPIAQAALKGDAVGAVQAASAAMGQRPPTTMPMRSPMGTTPAGGMYGSPYGMQGMGAMGMGMAGRMGGYGAGAYGGAFGNPMMRGAYPSSPLYPGPVQAPYRGMVSHMSPYYRNNMAPSRAGSMGYHGMMNGHYSGGYGSSSYSLPYGSSYGGSQYGGSQYGGSQYGASPYGASFGSAYGTGGSYGTGGGYGALMSQYGNPMGRGGGMSGYGQAGYGSQMPNYSGLYASAQMRYPQSRNAYPGVTRASYANNVPTGASAPHVSYGPNQEYTGTGSSIPQRPLPSGFTLPRHPVNSPLYHPMINRAVQQRSAVAAHRAKAIVSNYKVYQPTPAATRFDKKPATTSHDQYQNPNLMQASVSSSPLSYNAMGTSNIQSNLINQVASFDPSLMSPYTHAPTGNIYGGMDHYEE